MKKPEVLAPVGNMDMLTAGIAAGADCFYLALDDFGARAYAENFTLDNIKETIDFIHLFDKKVYITMNTLIKDNEMERALQYVEKLYEYGTDGLIIQDLGFYSIIKDKVLGMELHASTQMAVRDYYGAKYLSNLGFDRVVIARETPIEEIRKIASLPIETEVFVHGSLCVSFSGECLMSSYLGGRSANRGRCAGPCRQKYKLLSDGKVLADDYFLNMKDLNVIDHLDELIEIGVDCIKIEGRMKTPEYVYTSVTAYRNKIDNNIYEDKDLIDSSNRGYTRGFIFDQNRDYVVLKDDNKHRSLGKVEVSKGNKYFLANSDIGLGDNLEITTESLKKLPFTTTKAYKKGEKIILDKYRDAKINSDVLLLNSPRLKEDLETGLSTYKNLPIKIHFKAHLNEKPLISMTYKDKSVTYTHDVKVEAAQNIALSTEDIANNLNKFNDEIFTPSSIKIDIDKRIFLRKKDINECRRACVGLLKEEILRDSHRSSITINLPDHKKTSSHRAEKNIELLTNDVSIDLLEDFDNIYIRSYDKKYQGLSLYLILDAHVDYEIDELISYVKTKGIKGVVCNNYKDLNFIDEFKKNDIKIRIGRYLNVFNSYTFDFYSDFAEMVTSSVENNIENINANSKNHNVEALVFGRIELMNMRHCPFSVIKKCGLVGCPTCRFNNANMLSHDGNMMKVIRYGSYSKIYPVETSHADIDKFSDDVSMLYSVMDDQDLVNIKNTKIYETYEKGVI